MKNSKILLFLIFIVIFSCKKTENPTHITDNKTVEKLIPHKEFLKKISEKSEQEKQSYLFTYIDRDVPNYWTGTEWSFNGTSKEPKKGSIACGYFVTNILSDYGFRINGNYLAQQASSVMIKKLCTDIHHFSSVKEVKKYILSKEKHQIYIVGLDFHTGFLVREANDIYFLHSNYIKNEGVKKELIDLSKAFNYSKSFMIGNLKYKNDDFR